MALGAVLSHIDRAPSPGGVAGRLGCAPGIPARSVENLWDAIRMNASEARHHVNPLASPNSLWQESTTDSCNQTKHQSALAVRSQKTPCNHFKLEKFPYIHK